MTINKFNYEAFALDYLEGTLSVELTEEMERFLATHPAIEADLSGMMEVVYLEPDTSIVFEAKSTLLKEEKVVWLNKKWVRPLMAAASVALLLMTYFSGYQAGVKQGDSVVVVSGEKGTGSGNTIVVDAEKDAATVVDAAVESPVFEEAKLEKTVAKFVPKSTVQSTIIKTVKRPIEKENLKEISPTEPLNIVAVKLQNAENELIKPIAVQEVVAKKEAVILSPIEKLQPAFVNRTRTIDNSNNLDNALMVDVPVEKMAGMTIQKKKRSIKDFLGRFPVTQLKEALIPTYYKEENAGQ